MNTRLFLLPLLVLTLLICSAVWDRAQTVITFDDMSSSSLSNGVPFLNYLTSITNGYQGFNWANFYTLNVSLATKMFGTNGDYYGLVTASNVAFNGGGTASEIDSVGTNFNFLSTYLTGTWNSNLNVEVQGFSGASLLYDTTVVASATSPTLFTFNYLNIDRLTFSSFGGQNAGFPNGGGEQFAMDNFTFELVPEPSTFLLAAVGALMLWPFLKRKRTA